MAYGLKACSCHPLKTKKFSYYLVGNEKGIRHISDLYYGNNLVETFEDLVAEFDIPLNNPLINGIYLNWFQDSKNIQEICF